MAIKTIEYNVNIAGITPATEQFGCTQGDHRVAQVRFTVSDSLYNAVTAIAGDGKVVYRFDVYDGEGGIWSGDAAELAQKQVDFMLEERHTRHGGKITVYLVISAISAENATKMELYSFPAVLRLKNKPEGIAKEGENYESISALAQVAKAKALEATNTVDEAVARLEETAKNTFGKSAYQVAVENGFKGAEGDWLASLKGEKGDVGPRGVQGIQGKQGAQGVQGVQGEKGDKGDAFTYDDLTDEQKAELKEGIEQCVADQAYDPTSENAQSGVAVAEAVKLKVPMISDSGEAYPQAVIVKGGASLQMVDGTLYPADSDYQHLGIDSNYSKTISPDCVDVTQSKGHIACRDIDTGNLWTGTPIDNEDCANKQYVDETNKYRMPKVINNQVPFCTVPVVVGTPGVEIDEDGNFYPTDDSYRAIALDDGLYPKEGTSEMANAIVTRDSRGNLWTGDPVDDEDCVNKKYANQNYVGARLNDDINAPLIYAEPYHLLGDREDGYMLHIDDGGALAGNFKEFSGRVVRRYKNGNLLSGIPTTKHEVANKMYVDALVGDIESLLGGI